MKRILISIAIIFISVTTVFAQKELYFKSEKEDSISITSLHGISMSVGTNFGSSGIQSSFDIGYFVETKLTKSVSLILGANLLNSSYKSYTSQNNLTLISKYGLQLSLFAEPRWYFNYKNRVLKGKNGTLNTAWFLGLPIQLNTSYLNNNQPIHLSLTTPLTIGYRQSINDKMFIEAAGGIGVNTNFYSFTPIPYLKMKAGYTFK
ncbi:MAG TPA: hypothetical protein VIK55_11545 [Paludibacter sp.]